MARIPLVITPWMFVVICIVYMAYMVFVYIYFYENLVYQPAKPPERRPKLHSAKIGKEENATLRKQSRIAKRTAFIIYTHHHSGSHFVENLFKKHPSVYYMNRPLEVLFDRSKVGVIASIDFISAQHFN